MKSDGSKPPARMTAEAVDPSQCIAIFSHRESEADTDPDSEFWSGIRSLFADCDTHGQVVPNHKTEIRVRWTFSNLYFLFICPYLELNLKPDPNTSSETNELWNWDVAEVFVGADFKNTSRYREFEVSPQGEWVDLDINLDLEHPEDGWVWRSGCQTAARIDSTRKIWYGFIRVPYSAIDQRPAAPGNVLRINFYRSQGPESNRKEIAWRATHATTFHTAESFGEVVLGDSKDDLAETANLPGLEIQDLD